MVKSMIKNEFTWELMDSEYESGKTWILNLNGVRKAVIFFVGNHVERDDAYYIKFSPDINKILKLGKNDTEARDSLSDAKIYAEMEIEGMLKLYGKI